MGPQASGAGWENLLQTGSRATSGAHILAAWFGSNERFSSNSAGERAQRRRGKAGLLEAGQNAVSCPPAAVQHDKSMATPFFPVQFICPRHSAKHSAASLSRASALAAPALSLRRASACASSRSRSAARSSDTSVSARGRIHGYTAMSARTVRWVLVGVVRGVAGIPGCPRASVRCALARLGGHGSVEALRGGASGRVGARIRVRV